MFQKTSKTLVLFYCIFFIAITGFSQETVNENSNITLSPEQAKLLQKNEIAYKKWIDELQTPGVVSDDKQLKFNEEAQKLIKDPAYRSMVYKDKYTFVDVKLSLTNSEIQKAFWQLINIYPENKETVIRYIYAYDKVLPSDKLVISSFYTYAFFDPKITTLENGKPNIYRPDLFEFNLRKAKEIITYIEYLRKQEPKM